MVKPAGAYRPPGARGQAASSVYKREDEGGSSPSTPTPTPPHRGSYHGRGNGRDSPGPSTNGHGGYGGRGRGGPRHVPGAPPPQHASGGGPEGGEKVTRRKKGRDKRKGGKDGEDDGPAEEGEQLTSGPTTAGTNEASSSALASSIAAPEPLAAEGGLDPLQKKIRNLTKKVRFRPCWCVAVYNGVLTLIFPSTWPLWNRNSAQGYRGTQRQSERRFKARDHAVQKD